MDKVTKELLIKTVCFSIAIILLIITLKYTNVFETMKAISSRISNPSDHPLNAGEWAMLFGYRVAVYFGIPLLVTVVELIFLKEKRKVAWAVINLEAHFIALSIVCGIYYLFAIDYALGTKILTIEHSLTSLLLLLFTVILGKTFPHIFVPNYKELLNRDKK